MPAPPPLEFFVQCSSSTAADHVESELRKCPGMVTARLAVSIGGSDASQVVAVGASLHLLQRVAQDLGLLKWCTAPWPPTGHHFRCAYVVRSSNETAINEFRNDATDALFSPAERALLIGRAVEAHLPVETQPSSSSTPMVLSKGPLHPVHISNNDACSSSVLTARAVLTSALLGLADNMALTLPSGATSSALAHLQAYYGSKVGMYFAWCNLYSAWLLVPAFLGAVTFYFGTATASVDEAPIAAVYGVAVVVWAHAFIKAWIRRANFLAFEWGHINDMLMAQGGGGGGGDGGGGGGGGGGKTNDKGCYNNDEATASADAPRKAFKGKPCTNPITGRPDLRYPSWRRMLLWYPLSALVTAAILSVAFMVMCVSLNLQGYVHSDSPIFVSSLAAWAAPGAPFDPKGEAGSWASWVLPLVPVVAHVGVIFALNQAYHGVAISLTERENHRTQRAFNNALIVKRFLFEATDCYLALFYIALVERDVVLLRAELLSLFAVDTARRVFMETIVPSALHVYRGRDTYASDARLAGASKQQVEKKEEDHQKNHIKESPSKESPSTPSSLLLPATAARAIVEQISRDDQYDTYEDYLEMVLQFGYVVLFAAAFPLAPVIALPCNLFELRSDVVKLTVAVRRPNVTPVRDIGPWSGILRAIAWLAIPLNVFIMGCTSEQLKTVFPSYFLDLGHDHDVRVNGLWLMAALEHALLAVALAMWLGIADVTPSTRDAIARHLHVHRTLASALLTSSSSSSPSATTSSSSSSLGALQNIMSGSNSTNSNNNNKKDR